MDADGSVGLGLLGNDGKAGGMWHVDSDGSTALGFCDKGGKTRAVLGSTKLETTRTGATETTAPSFLVLFDKEGKVIFKAP